MGRSDTSKGSVSPSHIPLTGGSSSRSYNSGGSFELGGCSIKGEATKPGLSESEEVFRQIQVQLVYNHNMAAPILATAGRLWEIAISNQS